MLCVLLTVLMLSAFACTKRPPKTTPVDDTAQAADASTDTDTVDRAGISEEELYRQQYEQERAEVLQDVRFDYDSAALSSEARATLERIGQWMMKRPDAQIVIEGHCDERGSQEYNLALGERRAASAKSYLLSYGIEGSRLRTISYGEELPLDPAQNETAYAKNRRAHFKPMD